MNNREYSVYSKCNNKTEFKIAEKLLDGINSGAINEFNFWEIVSSYKRYVKAQIALDRWDRVADIVFKYFFGAI